MLRPRWYKVMRDLWFYKTRTLLVVLSIATGVFAFGTVAAAQDNVERELQVAYLAINPVSATLHTEPFDTKLVDAVRRMPAIAAAQGQQRLLVRIEIRPGVWYNLRLAVISQVDKFCINKVTPVQGTWPPPAQVFFIEQSSLPQVPVQPGEQAQIETLDGMQRTIEVGGIVQDLSVLPARATGEAYGYISLDTLEWLGKPRTYDQLQIVVAERPDDEAHIRAVAAQVANRIERSGRKVSVIDVPTPLEHPAAELLPTLFVILRALGIMVLFISAFLIINTIGAILAQQVRQIGVMKAIGARNSHIAGLYLSMVLIYGVLALVLAFPLGIVGARSFAQFIASEMSYDITHFQLPLRVILLKVASALLVPMLAALPVILSVTRMSVREAISGNDPGSATIGKGMIDRLIERIRGLPRPLLLSLRNTFRRKSRLIRTLLALTLGGAIFISVLTVRASLFSTWTEAVMSNQYDIAVHLNRPYRQERIELEALQVPGVVAVEGWAATTIYPIEDNGAEGEQINLTGLPPTTPMLTPDIVAGRWLLPADHQAILLTTNFYEKRPGVQVGDTIELKLAGEKRSSTWQIVGFTQEFLSPVAPANAYVSYQAFAHTFGGMGQVHTLRVQTAQRDPEFQARVVRDLGAHFDQRNIAVRQIWSTSDDLAIITERFNLLAVILGFLAVLVGMVGGLGLMGTMSINVIERTREIGVMRAIGASDGTIQQIILVEGMLIGWFSWLLGTLLSFPISQFMSERIGFSLLNMPLVYTYEWSAAWIWLVLVLVLSLLASYVPARNAARLTVREVLAYEG